MDWESDENLATVRTRVALIRKGCGCKSGCLSRRCKCRKNDSSCGPGCKCHGCCNLPPASGLPASGSSSVQASNPHTDSDSSGDDDDHGDNGSDLEMEVDQLMNYVFGTDDSESDSNMSTDFQF